MLLAAGKSGRMGKPKMLLPWDETTILGHQIRIWQQLCALQIAVVCAKSDDLLSGELDRLGVLAKNRILNLQPELGMFSSVRCAAQWQGWETELTHWVITLGDQPQLKLETLQTLLKFSAANPDKICQPRFLGRLRHPVIVPRNYFIQLGATRANTLKDFLSGVCENVQGVDIDDAGLDFDIDTPADYERALAKFLNPGRSGDDARAAASV